MAQLVVLHREYEDEGREAEHIDHFFMNDAFVKKTAQMSTETVEEKVEEAFRAAVDRFLWSEASKDAIHPYHGTFCWDDAVENVPDEVWAKYGILPVDQSAVYQTSGGILNIHVSEREELNRHYHEFPESILLEIVADSKYKTLEAVRKSLREDALEIYENEKSCQDDLIELNDPKQFTKLSTGHIVYYSDGGKNTVWVVNLTFLDRGNSVVTPIAICTSQNQAASLILDAEAKRTFHGELSMTEQPLNTVFHQSVYL